MSHSRGGQYWNNPMANYEEVQRSKLEALKALEENAKDQRVVLDEALVILGDLSALWTSLDDNGKQPGSRCSSRSW